MSGKELTVDFIFVDSNVDSLGAKLINALGFSHKHNFKFLSLWIVINKFCKFLIGWIALNRDVYCNPLFKINDVVLKSFNFNL